MPLSCGVGEDSWESLDSKEIQPVHPKGDQSWEFTERTDAEAETPMFWPPDVNSWLTHLKRPWSWERLRAGGEGDDSGWDGWMVSLTQWTWVWLNSGSWRWTGRPGMLWFIGSQRIGQDWVTELNWTELQVWLEHTVSSFSSLDISQEGTLRELESSYGCSFESWETMSVFAQVCLGQSWVLEAEPSRRLGGTWLEFWQGETLCWVTRPRLEPGSLTHIPILSGSQLLHIKNFLTSMRSSTRAERTRRMTE